MLIDFICKIEKKGSKFKLATQIPNFPSDIEIEFELMENGDYLLSFTPTNSNMFRIPFLECDMQLISDDGYVLIIVNEDISGVHYSNGVKINISVSKFQIEMRDIDDEEFNTVTYVKYSNITTYNPTNIIPSKPANIFNLATKDCLKNFPNSVELSVGNLNVYFYYERICDVDFFAFKSKSNSEFSDIVESIKVAYGLLSGYYMDDSIYSFAVKGRKLICSYNNINNKIQTNYPIITSRFSRDISVNELQLSNIQFNELVNLLYENEEYKRASILLINAGILTGCAKAALGAVALETITSKINDQTKNREKIFDKKSRKDIRENIELLRPKLSEEQFKILSNTVAQINQTPNRMKLEHAFEELGISLSEDDKDVINHRNRYLHGDLPKKKEEYWVTDIEYLDISAHRLVMLSSMLLLKKAKYEGHVVDYGMTMTLRRRNIKEKKSVPEFYLRRIVDKNI